MNSHMNKIQLSVDCQWSEWRVTECSVTCGNGVRKYSRFESQKNLFGGMPCTGESNRTEPCEYIACPGERREKQKLDHVRVLLYDILF